MLFIHEFLLELAFASECVVFADFSELARLRREGRLGGVFGAGGRATGGFEGGETS